MLGECLRSLKNAILGVRACGVSDFGWGFQQGCSRAYISSYTFGLSLSFRLINSQEMITMDAAALGKRDVA
jgi:hypothetical protein